MIIAASAPPAPAGARSLQSLLVSSVSVVCTTPASAAYITAYTHYTCYIHFTTIPSIFCSHNTLGSGFRVQGLGFRRVSAAGLNSGFLRLKRNLERQG